MIRLFCFYYIISGNEQVNQFLPSCYRFTINEEISLFSNSLIKYYIISKEPDMIFDHISPSFLKYFEYSMFRV